MRYLLVMLLAGCASVKSVKQPFVDIGIDGQPQVIETLDSASAPANNTNTILGAGDTLGLQTLQEFEDSKKLLAPDWYFLQYQSWGFLSGLNFCVSLGSSLTNIKRISNVRNGRAYVLPFWRYEVY